MKSEGEFPIELELQHKGADFSPLDLRLPEEIPMEDWAQIGRKLFRMEQVTRWWLGDWAAFGVGDKQKPGWRKYGRLKEFAEANGIDYGYLRNLAWVSQSVEVSRRRDTVSWTKHQEIAPLLPAEQTAWLAKIESEDLSNAEIRRQIRQAKGENNALAGDGPSVNFASKPYDELIHFLTSQPETFWTPERKAVWKARLQPLVEIYEKL